MGITASINWCRHPVWFNGVSSQRSFTKLRYQEPPVTKGILLSPGGQCHINLLQLNHGQDQRIWRGRVADNIIYNIDNLSAAQLVPSVEMVALVTSRWSFG